MYTQANDVDGKQNIIVLTLDFHSIQFEKFWSKSVYIESILSIKKKVLWNINIINYYIGYLKIVRPTLK